MAAGKKIKKFTDWTSIMLEFADKKLANNQFFESAFYYRAAEFYMLHAQNGKEELYDKFVELFYKHLPLKNIIQDSIPYRDSFLSALKLPHQSNKKNDLYNKLE